MLKDNFTNADYYIPSDGQRKLLLGETKEVFESLKYSIGHKTI